MLQSVGRLLLVVVNLFLVLVSLALITIGFVVKYAPQLFSTYTDSALDSIANSAKDSFSDSDFTTDSFSLDQFFGGIATTLIVLGFILMALCLFGCCGACCGIKSMLLAYALVLIVFVIGQIVIVVLVFAYSSVIKDPTKDQLKIVLNNYQGLNGTNVESLAWNFVMQQFECCGADGYTDFKVGNSKWFGEDDAVWKTPVACCKTLPKTSNFACAQANGHDVAHNNYNKGCVDEIWKVLIEQNKISACIGVAILLTFQILMIIFALVLYCKDDEKKVSPQTSQPSGRRNIP